MPKTTILAYYKTDHDRLDNLFKQYQRNKKTDFEKAVNRLKEFIAGLERHIIWEEEILFPVFESKSEIREGGPTAVMREEHKLIKSTLAAIYGKVQNRRADTDAEEKRLFEILKPHN